MAKTLSPVSPVTGNDALAIEGGPQAVTAPIDDRWERVTDLEKEYVLRVMDNFGDAYAELDLFEKEWREFIGAKHALVMCNGTATLHSAIFAAGAHAGKEVIVPSVTWHATISPILHCGATPVFCDADPETFCADPDDVRRKITDRTCAVVVTHVYGNPADMDAFRDIADETGIVLIEDASHAHGATWRGKPVGSFGDIGCFSLQKGKAMTGIEAGVAVTDDDSLYDRMLALGQYGRCGKLWSTDEFADLRNMGLGVKYRANPLAIGMVRAQFRRLPEMNGKRRAWFDRLDSLLSDIPGVHPQKPYPQAERGGLVHYAGTLDEKTIGAPINSILRALVAEGVKMTSEITPYGYGVMHLEPLFTDYGFDNVGGPWKDLPPDSRLRRQRGHLPASERIHDTAFWITTPFDPNPAWVEQVGAAFRKVIANADRLPALTTAEV